MLAERTRTIGAMSTPTTRSRTVHVLPHTHWDREWYDPYPAFRIRLVELLDELLPRLDADPAFRHFQLDGQVAVLDDYLEVRPAERHRLERLVAEGRLSIGPWYVLPDEFLVSGETLVRDLQLGLRRAGELGGAMHVGYLPDMFGHVAQMPQLLSLFGMHDAVVWRGVPAVLQAPAFHWRAPDGTSVRAEYLPSGYFNGSDMPDDADELRERVDLFCALQGPFVGDQVLWMAGMDHEVPPAHLPAVVRSLDEQLHADGGAALIGSLQEHLTHAAAHDRSLPTIDGELRSGARANLLMGVASNRVDVKVAAAGAERALERLAEPLDSLWQPDRRWAPLLELAWLGVIRNAAHDSICACSHDEVVDAVLHRYAESTRTATEVADRAVGAARLRMASAGTHLLNPTARARSEVVELTVGSNAAAPATVQVLEDFPVEQELHVTGAADAPIVVARELLMEQPQTSSVRLHRAGDRLEVHLLPWQEDGALGAADALGELGRRCAGEDTLQVVTVLHREQPSSRVLARCPVVPGYGWARAQVTEPDHPVIAHGADGLDNGLVAVEVDPADGTWSLGGLRGLGRLVDGGDVGDTYNWCPPEIDQVVDRPSAVRVVRTETGPLRGRIEIESDLSLPAEAGRDDLGVEARVGQVVQTVRTTLELHADEAFVRVTVELDHRVRDHRLRVHLPLPRRTEHSDAECAFSTVRRPLWAEGGPNEWGVPTYPSRRFVRAGGLLVTHEGLCEYELVDLDGEPEQHGTSAGELALTLVRATGWLSRGPMASRPLPAGPEDRLEGPQLQRPLRLRYAVAVDPDATVDAHELADRVWSPLVVVDAPGGGDLGPTGSLLQVHGAEVDAVLADPERPGCLVLRLHEPAGQDATLVVEGRTGTVVDLLGRELGPFDGTMVLRPHQIVTLRLSPDASPSASGRLAG